MPVRFQLNGVLIEEDDVSPSMTVLDYLRDTKGLKGTKEGCAEGDCGACSITIQSALGRVKTVNACLMLVPQLDGMSVVTVEGLSAPGDVIHPVQQALVENHAAQCGFCTPGFVMALYAFTQTGETVTPDSVHEAIAGNLCRCTGYRPIVDAAVSLGSKAEKVIPPAIDQSDYYTDGDEDFFAPRSLGHLVALRSDHPDAYILAGGTDLGMRASKDRQPYGQVISTANVTELNQIERDADSVTFGAAVNYTRVLPMLDELAPSFAQLVRRIGSRQIRNLGTIGGNICNASPIGDTPPCLIALDATMIAHGANGRREISSDEFFTDYRKTALVPDEILEAIRVPNPEPDLIFRAYKVSKRFDQDISAVVGAFALKVEDGIVASVRIAFGGMAATPACAPACEAALLGKPWSLETAVAAGAALREDFMPLTDFRASQGYRARVAENLIQRVFLDTTKEDVPVEVMAL
ncbi:MAG: xanthine dehydrogenase small subunit [Alphaproteobacteria bacterium]|nr:xanthine dehydrogenase small subunit [Alphaproteobacteria bacterium]